MEKYLEVEKHVKEQTKNESRICHEVCYASSQKPSVPESESASAKMLYQVMKTMHLSNAKLETL